jgi:hypothetical protein
VFSLAGFEIVKERALSRWRNLAHPVARRFFVIRLADGKSTDPNYAALNQFSNHAQAIGFAKGTDRKDRLDVPGTVNS